MVGSYNKVEGSDLMMLFILVVKKTSKLLILSNIEVSGSMHCLRRPSSVLDINNRT